MVAASLGEGVWAERSMAGPGMGSVRKLFQYKYTQYKYTLLSVGSTSQMGKPRLRVVGKLLMTTQPRNAVPGIRQNPVGLLRPIHWAQRVLVSSDGLCLMVAVS